MPRVPQASRTTADYAITCPQKHNNLTEEQQRLFNMAVFAQIVSEDPAEPRELSTLYIAAGDEYGGPDRAFEHGMCLRLILRPSPMSSGSQRLLHDFAGHDARQCLTRRRSNMSRFVLSEFYEISAPDSCSMLLAQASRR